MRIDAGASQKITVRFSGSALSPGDYQGYLRIRSTQTTVETVVPYWYGVPDRIPRYLSELLTPVVELRARRRTHLLPRNRSDGRGAVIADAALVRSVGQLGSVASVASEDNLSPGVFHAIVLLGSFEGPNVFEIQVGQIKRQIVIEGQI